MSVLEVRGLTLGYNRSDAVHGIDLDVAEGAVVSLIGANGAGKTTTLRGLSGLLKPRSGSVKFDGQEMAGQAAYKTTRAGIVQVPEGRQIFANMTVEENLRMGAYLVPDAAEIARRRAGVLDRFPRLGERLTQLAGLLSGGEQQMLAIGRALMSEPRLLLVDELSLGLMPKMVDLCLDALMQLKREGLTIVLVEQNTARALDVADQVCVMSSGVQVFQGTAAEAKASGSMFATFLGMQEAT